MHLVTHSVFMLLVYSISSKNTEARFFGNDTNIITSERDSVTPPLAEYDEYPKKIWAPSQECQKLRVYLETTDEQNCRDMCTDANDCNAVVWKVMSPTYRECTTYGCPIPVQPPTQGSSDSIGYVKQHYREYPGKIWALNQCNAGTIQRQVSAQECRDRCTGDATCNAVVYEEQPRDCTPYQCPNPVEAPTKPAAGSVAYVKNFQGYLEKVLKTGTATTCTILNSLDTQKTVEECRAMCTNDEGCNAFNYRPSERVKKCNILVCPNLSEGLRKDEPGSSGYARTTTSCSWRINKFNTDSPPLIINADTGKLVLPVKEGNTDNTIITRIPHNTNLVVSCSGPDNYFFEYDEYMPPLKSLQMKCTNGVLSSTTTNDKLKELGCISDVSGEIARDSTNLQNNCGPKIDNIHRGKLWELKYDYKVNNAQKYYTQLLICFDDYDMETIWVKHTLHGANYAASDGSPGSVSWKPDEEAGFQKDWIKAIYEIKSDKHEVSQQDRFDTLLIKDDGINFFAHGHLATNDDFNRLDLKKGTFHVLNCVPQWQEINNGNWKEVESSIQQLSMREGHQRDLTIVTGGDGIWISAEYGNPQLWNEVYLNNFFERNEVPIPDKLWKIVVERENTVVRGAVVFVVSNIPGSKLDRCVLPNPDYSTQTCATLSQSWLTSVVMNNKGKGCIECYTIENFRSLYGEVAAGLPDDIPSKAPLLL